MSASLSFPVVDIKVEGIAVDVTLSSGWLAQLLRESELEPSPDAPSAGRLQARLSRSGDDIVVRGHLSANLQVPCARCLEPAPIVVRTELSLLLEPKPRAESRSRRQQDAELEFSSAEADLDVYDGENVVLDGFVREAILLEVPQFPLCQESCTGIAVEQAPGGDDASFDPRLAPLSAFRKPREGNPREGNPGKGNPGEGNPGEGNPGEGPVTAEDLVAAARARASSFGRKPLLRTNRNPLPKKRRGKR